MPATEQTWRNQLRLHFVFGATGLLLLLCTLWMFAADHDRSWKTYQRNARNIDITLSNWRKYQFETDEYQRELERLEAALTEARGRGFDRTLIADFKEEVTNEHDQLGIDPPDFGKLDEQLGELKEVADQAEAARRQLLDAQVTVDRLKISLEEARDKHKEALNQVETTTAAATAAADDQKATAEQAAETARSAAADAADEMTRLEKQLNDARQQLTSARSRKRAAEEEVIPQRQNVAETLDGYISRAKFREDRLLQERKFKSADVDKAKADLDLAIRDSRPTDEPQGVVNERVSELQTLTLRYQARSQHRRELERIRSQLATDEAEAEKKLAEHVAEKERLEKSIQERQSQFRAGWLPGKKWLELPILDAFNSPLKIENLWSDELEWNINFRTTRRFDRCTTCHQNVLKTLPGSSTEPAYSHEQLFLFTLNAVNDDADAETGSAEDSGSEGSAAQDEPKSVEDHFGLRIASDGLLNTFDVTIAFIEPYSLAAQAAPLNEDQLALLPAARVRELSLKPIPIGAHNSISPGLLVGDVIESINGDRVRSAEQAEYLLQEAARSGESVKLTIRRGLPHPYATHPRLDLYLGSLSPHKLADFACSVCHEGQGSATEFKWASHTPNTPLQREEWSEEHGWFDNHHWIYPMYAKRFLQSTCIKCHHDVTELEASERFPEPPAPKLMHGYQLITKYGCFGCHEINGFDGPKRIGPDMRAEPNFFAAAQQLRADARYESLTDEEKDWVEQLIYHPERDDVRRKLYQRLLADATAAEPRLTENARDVIAPILKDLESPGRLRKVGPSLRFVKHKLDSAFLYDWIRDPQHFRPSTRMPKFFGLYDHLDGQGLDVAEEYEPIEILGLVRYLQDRSQDFSYLPPAEGVTSSAAEDKIARGKVAFEQQGCLACHSHQDFPDLASFRPSDQIQQAPDLSNVGDKFDGERNPRGRDWLYTWIKEPNKYHVRTLMPNLFLEPVVERDAEGNVTSVTDPVDDIVEYLMSSRSDWQPAEGTLVDVDDQRREALDKLTTEYLNDAFFIEVAKDYLRNGIPQSRAQDLKGAEKELLVPEDTYQANKASNDDNQQLEDDRKLLYIGRKTIAKYGCYGCHDIPGFEDAKPIGTGLADWGRKDPSRLAFEHIAEYIAHGHGHGHANGHGAGQGQAAPHGVVVTPEALAPSPLIADDTLTTPATETEQDPPPFYQSQLSAGNRIGFIYQKLREPRSYDFRKTENKKYNDRLRMPQFPFSVEERESVITFVLGLVGEPPKLKYVFKPNARTKALLEGRQVLEKYNCGGCHVLDGERWEISYRPGQYGEQQRNTTYPFLVPQPSTDEIQQSSNTDYRNLRHVMIEGLPSLGNDGLPVVNDPDGEPLTEDENYSMKNVEFSLYLFKPIVLDGFEYQVNERGLSIRGGQIERRFPANGGDLAKYLLPRVVAREQEKIPTLKGSEAWGWLPPPLINEGQKVQTDWLHSFLLEPYPIRPGVVLRMPKFNMTPQEATILVNYFAARDNAAYPYSYSSRQRIEHLQEAQMAHEAKLEELQTNVEGTRLDQAMRVVTNPNYCVQCHIVGDFEPTKEERGKGPDLSQVYKRLRPEYLRNWIAQPTVYLPYTGMPVNIKYDPELPFTGSLVPQELFPGESTDQLDGLVDLLMNYDAYSADRNRISPLVQEQQRLIQEQQESQEGTTPPETTEETTTEEAAEN